MRSDREDIRSDAASERHSLPAQHPRWTREGLKEEGDGLANEIVQQATTYLGISIANLINLYNPDLVIVGGPVGQAGKVMIEPIREEVQRRAMAYPLSAVKIEASSLGVEAGAIGAAVLVLQRANELFFQSA